MGVLGITGASHHTAVHLLQHSHLLTQLNQLCGAHKRAVEGAEEGAEEEKEEEGKGRGKNAVRCP